MYTAHGRSSYRWWSTLQHERHTDNEARTGVGVPTECTITPKSLTWPSVHSSILSSLTMAGSVGIATVLTNRGCIAWFVGCMLQLLRYAHRQCNPSVGCTEGDGGVAAMPVTPDTRAYHRSADDVAAPFYYTLLRSYGCDEGMILNACCIIIHQYSASWDTTNQCVISYSQDNEMVGADNDRMCHDMVLFAWQPLLRCLRISGTSLHALYWTLILMRYQHANHGDSTIRQGTWTIINQQPDIDDHRRRTSMRRSLALRSVIIFIISYTNHNTYDWLC